MLKAGLYISDLPLHGSQRRLVLMNEQRDVERKLACVVISLAPTAARIYRGDAARTHCKIFTSSLASHSLNCNWPVPLLVYLLGVH